MDLTIEKHVVSGIIVAAFMSAMYDFMGKDGLLSILRFAGLDDLMEFGMKNDYPKSRDMETEQFQAFLGAMAEIMGHGTSEILVHFGKHYLGLKLITYYGNGIQDMVRRFEEWMGGSWKIIKNTPEEVVIKITSDLFSPISSPGSSWAILDGIFGCILEQMTGEEYLVEHVENNTSESPSCTVTLKKV
ncbi:MAG: hypothetical protein ACXQS8_06120 [Candidatus Helarchaeales archaeon]